MAKQKSKMICPKCGDEMNHHADKLVHPVTAEELRHVNRAGRHNRRNALLSRMRGGGVPAGGVNHRNRVIFP